MQLSLLDNCNNIFDYRNLTIRKKVIDENLVKISKKYSLNFTTFLKQLLIFDEKLRPNSTNLLNNFNENVFKFYFLLFIIYF